MNDFLKKTPESVKLALSSSLPLVIVIILFIIVGNFGISKISDLQSQITQAQNDQNVLKGKLNLLQNVSAEVAAGSDISIAALPDANPSLVVVSQLRILASQNGLIITGIKTGGEVKD